MVSNKTRANSNYVCESGSVWPLKRNTGIVNTQERFGSVLASVYTQRRVWNGAETSSVIPLHRAAVALVTNSGFVLAPRQWLLDFRALSKALLHLVIKCEANESICCSKTPDCSLCYCYYYNGILLNKHIMVVPVSLNSAHFTSSGDSCRSHISMENKLPQKRYKFEYVNRSKIIN